MIDITRARSVARLHLDNGMVVSETDAKLICQALLAGGPLDAIRQKSAQMAEDAGLWFKAETCAEAYVQQELRKLCALIEQQPETVSDERDGSGRERSAARSEPQSASPGREERDYNSPAVAAPFDHNKRRGSAMSTAQQILPNLVEELRAEAGMSHGDGAETSLEWIAAARLLEAHVILQTWVNVSADMSADPLPKPLREIQDDEQALLIRAREWCRRMGQVSAEEADRFRWESHDWSPDTHTCRKCGAAISTKEACPFSPAPEQESPADTRDGAVAERSAARSEHPLDARTLEAAAKVADEYAAKTPDSSLRIGAQWIAQDIRALIPPSSEGGSPR
jgi:hypothetical protein